MVHSAPADINGVYEQIEEVGVATGNVAGAADLVAQMQTDIADIVAGVPQYDVPPTYYHELDNTLYSVTSRRSWVRSTLCSASKTSPIQRTSMVQPMAIRSSRQSIWSTPIQTSSSWPTPSVVPSRQTPLPSGPMETLSAVQNGRVVELSDDHVSLGATSS